MLVHLWPCENRPVFLQKSVGDLLVGGDFNFFFFFFFLFLLVVEGQSSISSLSFISVTWLVAATELCRLNLKSKAAFRMFTGNDCEMVPRSGSISL